MRNPLLPTKCSSPKIQPNPRDINRSKGNQGGFSAQFWLEPTKEPQRNVTQVAVANPIRKEKEPMFFAPVV